MAQRVGVEEPGFPVRVAGGSSLLHNGGRLGPHGSVNFTEF